MLILGYKGGIKNIKYLSLKKKKRTGFTLVELLVVIAILAVLASVSVIGYLGFVKKARVSNDVSLTTQMNRVLLASEAGGDVFDTPHDAISTLKDGGLDIDKLTPSADGYNYVYDINGKSGQKILLVDSSDNVVAPEGLSLSKENTQRYFFFAGTTDEVKYYQNKGYSVYLKDGFNISTLTVSTGIDVGNNEVNIKYKNEDSAQNVLIRTNGYTSVTINAPSDTIYHYGQALSVEITEVASESYHEYGNVEWINITKGHIVVEDDAKVTTLISSAVNANDVSFDISKKSTLNEIGAINENGQGNIPSMDELPSGVKRREDYNTVSDEILKQFNGVKGLGTKESPYLIFAMEQWNTLCMSGKVENYPAAPTGIAAQGKSFKVIIDLDFSTVDDNILCGLDYFKGNLDFNNHMLKGLTIKKGATAFWYGDKGKTKIENSKEENKNTFLIGCFENGTIKI